MNDVQRTVGPSLGMYFGASRLRTDHWDRLRNLAKKLESRRDPAGHERVCSEIETILDALEPLESYWAFPGFKAVRELRRMFEQRQLEQLQRASSRIARLLASDGFRSSRGSQHRARALEVAWDLPDDEEEDLAAEADTRPYFAVLVVDGMPEHEQDELKDRLRAHRRDEDEFVYEALVVGSFEDALIAVLLNYNIQSVVIRYDFPIHSKNQLDFLGRTIASVDGGEIALDREGDLGLHLGHVIKQLRPTLDLFLVTDAPVEDVAGRLGRSYRRVFYREEDYLELHFSILKGVRERYSTPFFSALKTYSQKPTGVFHALPISRSKSITKSHWIGDMLKFYGPSVFLAETSATTGGLDSLLQPHGPLKEAQELAARAFGARRSFFVTNGTSTANKIVMQALLQPEDIVLVSRDCHKSHHYSIVLLGAYPVYMDPYPLPKYSIYGGVPLREIKRQLLVLKRAGKLDRVKMLLLTNCTFDGVTYNVERVMEEVLAFVPDIAFVWDEAWYAFAHFTPIARRRTGMGAAQRLRARLESPEYRARYEAWKAETAALDPDDDATWLDRRLMPDPDLAKVRVYATQSTHKTLTSLRQGSMIHVYDVEFEQTIHEAFKEAYMTHTSTSPNYQILASLDVGRRQVELEGYELVQHSIELAVLLRERVNESPLLSKYFSILGPRDMIPETFRPSGFESYREVRTDWGKMDDAWESDEFALDPTRLTMAINLTGMDGDTFKNQLIEEHDIQINKTSRNTILLLTHIGTTRGATAHLIEVLTSIAQNLDDVRRHESAIEKRLFSSAVSDLTHRLPPLPDFSRFHAAFRPGGEASAPGIEGDLRTAFFLAGEEDLVEYLKLDGTVQAAIDAGREVVTAAFVIPYPPGFPILVPGQVVSRDILEFLKAVDVKEIHGFAPEYGLRVFTEAALEAQLAKARGPSV